MNYDFSTFGAKVLQTEEWLKKELSSIRTGRATPVILDSISVDAYGTKMGIREIAAVNVEDPKTIRIAPWDHALGKSIEKAITDSDLGISVSIDDKGLRIIFPELTSERRVSLIKILKQKHEEARVALRKEREAVKSDIEAKEKEGQMGEDEKFRLLEELQKRVEVVNKRLDELAEKKEREISE
jgi:ribosome recycling factor